MAPDDEYKVGYGKPPKEYQYKKGQSGNLGGRPRKPQSIPELLAKVIKQKVRINGKNGLTFMTKLEASITQMANKSASGDLEAFKVLMQMLKLFPETLKDDDRNALATNAQVKLLALVEARYGSCAESEGPAEGEPFSDRPNSTSHKADGNTERVTPAAEGSGGFGQSGEHSPARGPGIPTPLEMGVELPAASVPPDDGDPPP